MKDIADIIMRPSAPGTLIFAQTGALPFSNSELVVAHPALPHETRNKPNPGGTRRTPHKVNEDNNRSVARTSRA